MADRPFSVALFANTVATYVMAHILGCCTAAMLAKAMFEPPSVQASAT